MKRMNEWNDSAFAPCPVIHGELGCRSSAPGDKLPLCVDPGRTGIVDQSGTVKIPDPRNLETIPICITYCDFDRLVFTTANYMNNTGNNRCLRKDWQHNVATYGTVSWCYAVYGDSHRKTSGAAAQKISPSARRPGGL